MRERLAGLLEKADLALASSAEIIEDEKLHPLIDAVQAVRTRLAYPDDVLVVALAGGTGSGKSSLFNAFCDEELVHVGGVRPTTWHPAAAVPEAEGPAIDGYLDRLGIEERHTHPGPRICLIDLPDTDSVELEHRFRVDSILPLVDVVVWVTDPEKYRDARLHQEYLTPLSPYASQFVVVINQIDRLGSGQLADVRADLESALEEDGLDGMTVIEMAAAPPVGPPIGLDSLTETLESKLASRATLYDKLLTDVATTCRALESEAGGPVDFDSRAEQVTATAADALASGDAAGTTYVLTRFLDGLAGQTGGVTAGKIEAVAAGVPSHIRRVADELTPTGPPERRRWFRRRKVEKVGPDTTTRARSLISEAVVRPVRAILARRALALASVVEVAVEVESMRQRPSR